MKPYLVAGAMLCLSALPVSAQSLQPGEDYNQAVRNGDITSGRSDEGPGGLTARDVVGKHLMDSDGNPIGTIQTVSPDGRTAMVAPTGGGKPVGVDMDKLGLGMGAHTVIEQSYSHADLLNAESAAELARRQAALAAAAEPPPAPPPAPTTLTTQRTQSSYRSGSGSSSSETTTYKRTDVIPPVAGAPPDRTTTSTTTTETTTNR